MNIANILCPVDFSDSSDTALLHASALARNYHATLHFVYVYEPHFVDSDIAGMPTQPVAADLEPIRQRLEAIRPAFEGIPCCHQLLFGFPGGSLVNYARGHDIDLIVMSTHGRTGASRLLLGSVAEAVVRSAPCPVLTVRDSKGLRAVAPPEAAHPNAEGSDLN